MFWSLLLDERRKRGCEGIYLQKPAVPLNSVNLLLEGTLTFFHLILLILMFTREILNKDNSWKKKNKEYPNEDYLDAYKEITYEGQSNIPCLSQGQFKFNTWHYIPWLIRFDPKITKEKKRKELFKIAMKRRFGKQ